MDKFTSRAFEASEMFLIRRGYEIIERTWKANDGEGPVGIIAKEDNAIVFVTVKSRKAKDKGFPESTAKPSRSTGSPATRRSVSTARSGSTSSPSSS